MASAAWLPSVLNRERSSRLKRSPVFLPARQSTPTKRERVHRGTPRKERRLSRSASLAIECDPVVLTISFNPCSERSSDNEPTLGTAFASTSRELPEGTSTPEAATTS